MPLDFPSSPTNGQYYNGYVYNSANDTWDSAYAPRAATIPISSPNYVINGGMDIWQRGTSGTVGGSVGFAADRWQSVTYAGGTMYWFQQPATGNPGGTRYCSRIQRASGATNAATTNLCYSFETTDVLKMAGKTLTLSYYARAGANYSPAGAAFNHAVTWGTGTDQSVFGTGITGGSDIFRSSVTLTTSWQRFTVSFAVPANATSLGISLYSGTNVGTAGAADYWELTGVQLEDGSAATDFRRNAPSIQGELAACQRYYYRAVARGANAPFAVGQMQNSTTARYQFSLPVPMRATPSLLEYSGPFQENSLSLADSLYTVNAIAIESNWYSDKIVYLYVSNTGGTAGRVTNLSSYNSANAYIAISSEL